jgi:hypothetical protein
MRLDEKAKEKREEKGERVDDYVSLLTRARAREGNTHAASRRSYAGLNIVTKHTEITASSAEAAVTADDDLREPVAAEQGQIIREGDAPRETDRFGGDASCPDTESCEYCDDTGDVHRIDGEWLGFCHCEIGQRLANAANIEMDRATEGSFETGSEAAEKGREAIPAGPEGADLSHAGAGESPAPNEFLEDVPPMPMKRLHYAHCFPDLTKTEYGRLEFSIIGIGVSKPIIRMGDVIVDGWARYNICRTLGISYPIQNYSGNDVLLDVIEWQRASRNFTPAQEKKIAADLAKEIPHRANDIMAAFGLADEALEAAE